MSYTRTTLELRLNAHGLYFAEYYNIKPENSALQNTLAEKAMRSKLQGLAARVLFKAGTYKFAEPIVRQGDYLTYEGVRGAGWDGPLTTLYFEATDGVALTACNCEALRNLRIRGNSHDKAKGEGGCTGLIIRGLSNTWGVGVSGFSRLGVLIEGDLARAGTNSSGTQHYNLWVAANWAGVRVGGMDANSISFYGMDVRDHVGYGYEDNSLLGTNLFGCMFHANWAGHIHIPSLNAPTGLFGVYEEAEENPSVYSGLTTRIAGYSYGTKGGFILRGAMANSLSVDELTVNKRLSLSNDYGGPWNLSRIPEGWQFDYSSLDYTKQYLLAPGVSFRGQAVEGPCLVQEWPARVKPLAF